MKERPALALIELLLAGPLLASAGARPASDFLNVRDLGASGSTFQRTGRAQAGSFTSSGGCRFWVSHIKACIMGCQSVPEKRPARFEPSPTFN
jgi:hypothetical protein